MDARELFVLRDSPCRACGGFGAVKNTSSHGPAFVGCRCAGGVRRTKVPLIDALRELGIDVPEPEEAPAAMCPP